MGTPDNSTQISNRNIVLILCFVIILPIIAANYEVVISCITEAWAWVSAGKWHAERDEYPARFWSNIATILGALIAILGLGGIYLQLHHNARQARRLKTYDLASKYHEPEFFDRALRATYFLTSKLQPYQIQERFFNKSNPYYTETRSSCGLLFNFYEDMSLMYNMDLVDKELFVRLFGGTVLPAFQASKALIDEYRKRELDNQIFIEWEECAKDVEFRLISKAAKS